MAGVAVVISIQWILQRRDSKAMKNALSFMLGNCAKCTDDPKTHDKLIKLQGSLTDFPGLSWRDEK